MYSYIWDSLYEKYIDSIILKSCNLTNLESTDEAGQLLVVQEASNVSGLLLFLRIMPQIFQNEKDVLSGY